MNERRQWYADHGICYNCGQRDAEPNKKLCFECGEKNRMRVRKYYYSHREKNIADVNSCKRKRKNRLKAKGLCVTCGKRQPLPGILECFGCKNKRIIKYREKSNRLPQDMRGNGIYCYRCCRPICNGTKLCEDCRKRSVESVAYARKFINKNNQVWRKYDSANVAEIHYKARSVSNDNS